MKLFFHQLKREMEDILAYNKKNFTAWCRNNSKELFTFFETVCRSLSVELARTYDLAVSNDFFQTL